MAKLENLRPGPGRLLIEIDEPPKESKGGIILPENAKKDPIEFGRVLAYSDLPHWDGAERPSGVKEGATVYFRNFSLFDIKLEDDDQDDPSAEKKKIGTLEFQDILAYAPAATS